MVTEQIINTVVGGVVAIKVLEKGAEQMKGKKIKGKKTKIQKIKPIKKFKQIKY